MAIRLYEVLPAITRRAFDVVKSDRLNDLSTSEENLDKIEQTKLDWEEPIRNIGWRLTEANFRELEKLS